MNREESIKKMLIEYIERIDNLLATDVFTNLNTRVFLNSVVTEILICLTDLLDYCSNNNNRINFTDDIDITGKVKDITDLIHVCRNALCHVDSFQRYGADESEGQLVYIYTSIASQYTLIRREGEPSELLVNREYSDINLRIGDKKLNVNNHIIRAYNEARAFVLK